MASAHNKSFNFEKIIGLRHRLRAHPELSGKEKKTSDYMIDYLLDNCAPDELIPLTGTGFAVVYKGKTPGKTILIQTEMDAPSYQNNPKHTCGHDGHMAIVTGIAQIYAQHRPESGRIVLLFQSNSQSDTKAKACYDHDNFKKIEPDYICALQILSGYPKHEIICQTTTDQLTSEIATKNGLNYTITKNTFPNHENISELIKHYKGTLFGLGAGENAPALYSPNYNFPDEILLTGIIMFKELIDQTLHPEKQETEQETTSQRRAA